MNKEKKNGVNVLTEQQEEMRMQVIDLELKARYWKAQYELRDYTLKCAEIGPAYEEYAKKEREAIEKAKAEFLENIEKMQKEGAQVEEVEDAR